MLTLETFTYGLARRETTPRTIRRPAALREGFTCFWDAVDWALDFLTLCPFAWAAENTQAQPRNAIANITGRFM
jgi:hypothetical protein